ncbi:MAG TPA: integrase arm-type DNA-binding domain-containing protein [Mesorhizobium sp.]|jgi:integrase|nr:integrase arm-type DNA-binding domain-containing protein [Mesorhizobium sp.]
MARALNKLTDTACKAAVATGLLGDGGGLYLNVKPTGAKSWAFIWRDGAKRREMGLGAYPAVKLARARALAADCRTAVAEGRDPIAERRKEEEPTFDECAAKFLDSMEGQWRNAKHRAQWRMTLDVYAGNLSKVKVSKVSTADVLAVLTPIWKDKPETASRLRGRIERVLDFAKARGWRSGENPALWRGHLKNVLPARQKLTRGHHAAMPYRDVPAFMERLREADTLAARALELVILTATRSGEALNASWSEFDLDSALWVIPAHRMKAGKEHRVPLSASALALLKGLHEVRTSPHVFPSLKPTGEGKLPKPLSNMAMEMLLRRMKADVTVHGFRSAFRDWAGDETHFPRDVAEQALAHRVGDATEQSYRRADALEKRRQLMAAWAHWCENLPVQNVVALRGA